MDELYLSLINPFLAEGVRGVLGQFALSCKIDEMTWDNAWEELTKIGLYRSGPDVSQVGTTWLEGFVAAGAVRSFTDEEVDSMGGASAFFPSVWQAVLLHWGRRKRVWAIPWSVDTRVIFYWRDMFEEAGIDETTAFATFDQVEESMAHLQDSGAEVPWGIWALGGGIALQNAASWVWGYGGDFMAADGRQLLFDRPEAIKGFTDHLKLCRYMPPGITSIDAAAIDARGLFARRQVAVIVGLCNWLSYYLEQSGVDDVVNRLGVATIPGPAFVGGSSLIIWRHARPMHDAVATVRTLAGKQLLQTLLQSHLHFFPTRMDMWSAPPYAGDPHCETVAQAIKTGRAFPTVSRWGMFENRLSRAVVELWNNALGKSDRDLTDVVAISMGALAQRFAVSLGIRR